MSLVIKFLLALLLLLALLHWLGDFWRRRYAFEPGYQQIHFTHTRDGWRIGLGHYPPERRLHALPVILCHGLGANRFNFDLGPGRSLARYLQSRGFEVWSLDLRGRGLSRSVPRNGNSARGPRGFDAYVQEDARAAVEYVKRQCGAPQVHWVGHSMGGLVLYGFLQGEGAEDIASGTAVASPGNFSHLRRIPGVSRLFRLLRPLPRVHQAFFAAAFAPVLPLLPRALLQLVLNPANVEPLYLKRASCHLISDMTRAETCQFSDWIQNREFRSFDRTYSYERNLAAIRRPLLLLAGSRDFLGTAESVAYTHDLLPGEHRRFVMLGRQFGQTEDYGHGDLLIGKRCEQEVYPLILAWLQEFDPGQAPTGTYPDA